MMMPMMLTLLIIIRRRYCRIGLYRIYSIVVVTVFTADVAVAIVVAGFITSTIIRVIHNIVIILAVSSSETSSTSSCSFSSRLFSRNELDITVENTVVVVAAPRR